LARKWLSKLPLKTPLLSDTFFKARFLGGWYESALSGLKTRHKGSQLCANARQVQFGLLRPKISQSAKQ